MAVLFSPIFNSQVVDDAGNPAVGWKVYTYVANSSTPQTTYTTSAGNVQQSNPIVINALGFPTVGQIWLTQGQVYKLQLTDENDVVQKTEDQISGVNDVTVSQDQWVASGLTPTFVSTTSFTFAGDQTTTFHPGRRLKTTNSGGTIYSTITASVFGALTTITVVNDSGVLDSGLSAVSYGLLSSDNPSTPLLADTHPIVRGSSDATKMFRFEVDGFTTGNTRVWTPTNSNLDFSGRTANTILAGPASGVAADAAFRALVGAEASLVLIETKIASASATVDFATGINSTYDQYVIKLTNVIPASTGVDLYIRVSEDGGGTYKAGASDYRWMQNALSDAGTNTPGGSTANGQMAVTSQTDISSTASAGGVSGEVNFFAPSGTTANKHFNWEISYHRTAATAATKYVTGGGYFVLDTNAINGVRFLMNSGNIASGTFALYGVRKA